MTIKLLSEIEDGNGLVAKVIRIEGAHDYKIVQEIFQRAGNLWPDASPQAKKIIDLVTNGQIMQEYGPDDKANGDKHEA